MGVDVPVDLPDFPGNLIEETDLVHFIAELGFEDDGESSDGEIEIGSGGVPEAVSGGEGTAGHDVMDMGVKLEGSSPGVKDAEESREISADVVLIWSEFLDGVGRGFEQGRISHPLVLTDEAVEVVRDG